MFVALDKIGRGKEIRRFVRIGKNLYRRREIIYARVKVDGKKVWRSTETEDPETARAVMKE